MQVVCLVGAGNMSGKGGETQKEGEVAISEATDISRQPLLLVTDLNTSGKF